MIIQEIYNRGKLVKYKILELGRLRIFDIEKNEENDTKIKELFRMGEIMGVNRCIKDEVTGREEGYRDDLVLGTVNVGGNEYLIALGSRFKLSLGKGDISRRQGFVLKGLNKVNTLNAYNIEWCLNNLRKYREDEIYGIEELMLEYKRKESLNNRVKLVGRDVVANVSGEMRSIAIDDINEDVVIPSNIQVINMQYSDNIKCGMFNIGRGVEVIEKAKIQCKNIQLDNGKLRRINRMICDVREGSIELPSTVAYIGDLTVYNANKVVLERGITEVKKLKLEGDGEVEINGDMLVSGIVGKRIDLGEDLNIDNVKANSIIIGVDRELVTEAVLKLPERWRESSIQKIVSKISVAVTQYYSRYDTIVLEKLVIEGSKEVCAQGEKLKEELIKKIERLKRIQDNRYAFIIKEIDVIEKK